ncbi:hypothetical protein RHA1_ro00666 [Rhodococcus jostii RHA1]|uniref:Uncharacterized protein n=1 Tax=Rhodococcus jostii (strain RHA1) TaxID=101510 RepID=Q0SIY5_RHOJR|nr:hypothetical protein RHA1_ro00666 [Rhodococcus jostii RHA1]
MVNTSDRLAAIERSDSIAHRNPRRVRRAAWGSLIGLDGSYLSGYKCEVHYRAGWLLPLEVDLLARVERRSGLRRDEKLHRDAEGVFTWAVQQGTR